MRFESILGLSIAVHLVLMIVISSTMEMLDYEDVPIKARVNIRFDYPQKKSKSIQKPVLKLESGSKALSLQPIQPLPEVQKPVLKTIKNSLKPEITKPSRVLSYGLEKHPNSPLLIAQKGKFLVTQGKVDQGIICLEEAVSMIPGYRPLQNDLQQAINIRNGIKRNGKKN